MTSIFLYTLVLLILVGLAIPVVHSYSAPPRALLEAYGELAKEISSATRVTKNDGVDLYHRRAFPIYDGRKRRRRRTENIISEDHFGTPFRDSNETETETETPSGAPTKPPTGAPSTEPPTRAPSGAPSGAPSETPTPMEQTISQECVDDMQALGNVKSYGDTIGAVFDECPGSFRVMDQTPELTQQILDNTYTFLEMDLDMQGCDTSALEQYCRSNNYKSIRLQNFTATCYSMYNVEGEWEPRTTVMHFLNRVDCVAKSCPRDHAEWNELDTGIVVSNFQKVNCTVEYLDDASVVELLEEDASTTPDLTNEDPEMAIAEQCVGDLYELGEEDAYRELINNITLACPNLIPFFILMDGVTQIKYDMTGCDTSQFAGFCAKHELETFEQPPFTATCERRPFDTSEVEAAPRTITFYLYYVLNCFPKSCPLEDDDWTIQDHAITFGELVGGDCTFQFLGGPEDSSSASASELAASAAAAPISLGSSVAATITTVVTTCIGLLWMGQ